ncbi:doublecortin domain-containing protein 2B isoform X2 [Hemicordylus capensis]|uniref:doublecortin domain-containing protein 2B isoform X2 n=1 Tax=Hemicordylus capensis TaxID=884348 RepID=UPI00230488CB|nr:doublecortin domain-containing protein 2B isoform X2 [Hemicordylus capensis]
MSRGAVAVVAAPAKNVVVYRNGDPFFHGRKLVVNQRRFLTFEAFLNEVTSTVQAPMAVRSIYTPRQGHRVTGLSELENGCQYVAAGFERFKRIDYQNSGMKQLYGNRKKYVVQNYPVISQRANVLARWRRQDNSPFVIHVFRNGDLLSPPFRLALAKNTLQEWSALLGLLSEKANLRSGAVKKLCRLNGDTVSSAEDLVSGDYYVAVGLESYKSLPYIELLVPPKTARQPFRNLSNRRRSHNRRLGKCPPASQDGASDSALLEPPQLDRRRVQSTGTVEEEHRPAASLEVLKQAAKHPRREAGESIFHAKPVRVRQISRNSRQSSDQGSVYKMKGARREMQGAQEVGEDEETQVELPVDQKAAETVEEEVLPRTKVLPPRKVENIDKLQRALPVQHSAGDLGAEMARKPHFQLAQR